MSILDITPREYAKSCVETTDPRYHVWRFIKELNKALDGELKEAIELTKAQRIQRRGYSIMVPVAKAIGKWEASSDDAMRKQYTRHINRMIGERALDGMSGDDSVDVDELKVSIEEATRAGVDIADSVKGLVVGYEKSKDTKREQQVQEAHDDTHEGHSDVSHNDSGIVADATSVNVTDTGDVLHDDTDSVAVDSDAVLEGDDVEVDLVEGSDIVEDGSTDDQGHMNQGNGDLEEVEALMVVAPDPIELVDVGSAEIDDDNDVGGVLPRRAYDDDPIESDEIVDEPEVKVVKVLRAPVDDDWVPSSVSSVAGESDVIDEPVFDEPVVEDTPDVEVDEESAIVADGVYADKWQELSEVDYDGDDEWDIQEDDDTDSGFELGSRDDIYGEPRKPEESLVVEQQPTPQEERVIADDSHTDEPEEEFLDEPVIELPTIDTSDVVRNPDQSELLSSFGIGHSVIDVNEVVAKLPMSDSYSISQEEILGTRVAESVRDNNVDNIFKNDTRVSDRVYDPETESWIAVSRNIGANGTPSGRNNAPRPQLAKIGGATSTVAKQPKVTKPVAAKQSAPEVTRRKPDPNVFNVFTQAVNDAAQYFAVHGDPEIESRRMAQEAADAEMRKEVMRMEGLRTRGLGAMDED